MLCEHVSECWLLTREKKKIPASTQKRTKEIPAKPWNVEICPVPEKNKDKKMAYPEGLEPPTFWSVARHSIQLSYGYAT